MTAPRRSRPPLLGRLLLKLRRLGERRGEVESDLLELFLERAAERGRWYAALRYCADAASLWIHRSSSRGVVVVAPRRGRGLDGLSLDVRFALRMFCQRPLVVSVTVAGLALAIAVSSTIFGLAQAIVLMPIGIPDPSSVVVVHRVYANGRSSSYLWQHRYRRLADAVSSVQLEALATERAPFGDTNQEEVRVALVSGGFFESMGVGAALGRVLTEEDDRSTAPLAAVVNHAFWERELGGDESIVGKTVRLMGAPFTVVGVVEEGFNGLPRQGAHALWVPAAIHDRVWRRQPPRDLAMGVVGRIADGTTRQQAEDEVEAAILGIAPEWTGDGDSEIVGVRLQAVDDVLSGPEGRTLRWILGTIAAILGLVLLLACTNVANLLLANAMSRRREVGVRLALGASRARIVRQLLTESLMLGALSGCLGLLLAFWLLSAADTFLGIPWTNPVAPDFRFFGFAVVFALLAGIGAGLAPARYGARGDLAAPLKGDAAAGSASRKPNRARSVLVGVQAAVSIVLLVMAALLGRSVVHATQYDLGFDADQLVTLTPRLDAAGYDVARAADYWNRVLERVTTLPGVDHAALVSYVPFGGVYGRLAMFQRDGRQHTVYFNYTSSGYFATAGIPVVRGRSYTAAEVAAGAPVAVVSEGLARKLWNGEDALGATLGQLAEDLSETRVVGIVGDAPLRLDFEADMLYLPVVRADGYGSVLSVHLIARARGDAETVLRPVHEAVLAIDPEVLPRTTLTRDGIEDRFQRLGLNVTMAGMLGGVALALACIGVFSITAFSVEQRTGEIGVRLAVGASVSDIVLLMLRDSLRPVVVGLVVGLLAAIAGSRVLTAVLYGVSPYDPLAIVGAVAILLASAVLAAGVPSRRATQVDPVIALRNE